MGGGGLAVWWDAASGTCTGRWGLVVDGWVLRRCWADLTAVSHLPVLVVYLSSRICARQRRSRFCECSPARARRNPASALARTSRDRCGHCPAPLDEKESASAAASVFGSRWMSLCGRKPARICCDRCGHCPSRRCAGGVGMCGPVRRCGVSVVLGWGWPLPKTSRRRAAVSACRTNT